MPKRSLRTRIAAGLAIYSLMLATVIIGVGYSVHESLELLVWRAQLDGEISSYLSDRARNPDTALPQSGKLRAYLGKADSIDIPSSLRQLGPGIHDDVNIDGRESAVMVRELDGERIYMTIDIGVFETEEKSIAHVLLGLSLFGAAGLVITLGTSLDLLLRPEAVGRPLGVLGEGASTLIVGALIWVRYWAPRPSRPTTARSSGRTGSPGRRRA